MVLLVTALVKTVMSQLLLKIIKEDVLLISPQETISLLSLLVCTFEKHLLQFFFIDKGEVYNWGSGYRGVFADESRKHLKSPTINEAIEHLKHEEGTKLVKIKACGDQVLALFGN